MPSIVAFLLLKSHGPFRFRPISGYEYNILGGILLCRSFSFHVLPKAASATFIKGRRYYQTPAHQEALAPANSATVFLGLFLSSLYGKIHSGLFQEEVESFLKNEIDRTMRKPRKKLITLDFDFSAATPSGYSVSLFQCGLPFFLGRILFHARISAICRSLLKGTILNFDLGRDHRRCPFVSDLCPYSCLLRARKKHASYGSLFLSVVRRIFTMLSGPASVLGLKTIYFIEREFYKNSRRSVPRIRRILCYDCAQTSYYRESNKM